jgi:hypothetical protein
MLVLAVWGYFFVICYGIFVIFFLISPESSTTFAGDISRVSIIVRHTIIQLRNPMS